jgi:TonB family protein
MTQLVPLPTTELVEKILKIARRRLFVAFQPKQPCDFVVAEGVHFQTLSIGSSDKCHHWLVESLRDAIVSNFAEESGFQRSEESALFNAVSNSDNFGHCVILRESGKARFPVKGKGSTELHPFFSLGPVSDYDKDCRVLEIEPWASPEEIRQAYLDQTKIWHPDRFPNDIRLQKKAEEKLKQINVAYQRLCGRGPYEPPVLNRSKERSPSEWSSVFVALRRALRKSVIAITKPFGLFIAKTVNVSNKFFQSCRRQRRSLGIATTALLLGFVLGVWFSPHKSETWAKINNLREKIIEKARGTAQVAVAEPSPTAPTTVLSQKGPLTASSAETTVPAPPPSIATSSSPPIAGPSGDVFPWKTNVVTTVFWVGQEQVAGKTSPQHQSVWDKDWLKSFGGVDSPEPAARRDYIPMSFVPRQNPFYCALPYNDVEQGQFKPEAPIVIPWFKQVPAEPGQSVCKDRWVAIRKGDRICYAQWEDCGPFRTDHFQYVFQNERPTPNASHDAGLSVSPAVRDHLRLAPTDVADWQFVEVSDVPPGPWRDYGENNPFVIARRQPEKSFAEQKRSADLAATKPAQAATPADESMMSPSAANFEKGFAEQKGSGNQAAMEPAQGATPANENVMSASAANLEKGFAEQKKSVDSAAATPTQGATPPDESEMSPPVARPEKGFAERKRPAIQAATKPAQTHRSPGESVISASAAKPVTIYAPRPDYPQEARSRRIAGSGVCVVSVDASGSVTNVSMARSTGSPLLDKSVLRTVRTWRFKPGTVGKVSVPVEFTLEGDNR